MFDLLFERYGDELDNTMRGIVDTFDSAPEELKVMLQYPFGWLNKDGTPYSKPTGKRVRPFLLLLSNEASGGEWQRALSGAAAIEILHNFSLVHDDIQDQSDIRHGRLTVWKVWGEAQAINVGDAMFALSYHALEHLSAQNFPSDVLIDVWRVYNKTILELTRGQYLDMSFEKREGVTVDEYLLMVQGKTAALLSGTAYIGSFLGSSSHEKATAFADFGLNLGLAFQIRDDILGIWGDEATTGKSAATDIASKKKSLPVLYGLSHSDALANLYRKPSLNDDDVLQAVELLDELDARSYTQQLEQKYHEAALAALQKAEPEGEAYKLINMLVDALFGRNS